MYIQEGCKRVLPKSGLNEYDGNVEENDTPMMNESSSSDKPPKLYNGNNRIHSVMITKYDKLGNSLGSTYISGMVLSKYEYNTVTNSFSPLPSNKIQDYMKKTIDTVY